MKNNSTVQTLQKYLFSRMKIYLNLAIQATHCLQLDSSIPASGGFTGAHTVVMHLLMCLLVIYTHTYIHNKNRISLCLVNLSLSHITIYKTENVRFTDCRDFVTFTNPGVKNGKSE